jgi:hypothetical protein
MNDNRREQKRSHQLAMDNLRSITEKLREERNDALARLQIQQKLIADARQLLQRLQVVADDQALSQEIERWLSSSG